MSNSIKRLPLDTTKQHFVVGDIHGHFDTFMNLLAEANYDPENDIIYSVGDIIDRGPKSYEALVFFDENENCHNIMGNHEYMAGPGYTNWGDVWIDNGGIACMDSLREHNKDHNWLRQIVKDLPWVIKVGEDNEENSFQIIHADFPPELSDQDLEDRISAAEYGKNPRMLNGEAQSIQPFIWGRNTISLAQRNIVHMKPLTYEMEFNEDRSRRTFVGHTPIKKILTVGDITFVDTLRGSTMSMVEAISGDKFTTDAID